MSVSSATREGSARVRRGRVAHAAIAFACYVLLGSCPALLGVAWPSMRATFGLELDRLGVLLVAATLGSTLASLNVGRLVARLGLGPALAAGAFTAGLGLTAFALAPGWSVLIAASVLLTVGLSTLDVGMNGRFGADPRVLTWLHASAGLGFAIGPAVMTAAISRGGSWRYGYAWIAATLFALAVVFLATLPRWSRPLEPGPRPAALVADPMRPPLDRYLPYLAILLAFLYGGIERTAGNWSFSLFTESRGLAPGLAGVWMSLFWVGYTAGRALTGLAVGRVPVSAIMRLSLAGMVLGAAGMTLRVSPALNLAGLVVLGLCIGPIYPLLTSSTARRVGASRAVHAVGLQATAASLGCAIPPALVGVLAQSRGLEVLGPVLMAGGLVTGLLAVRVMSASR